MAEVTARREGRVGVLGAAALLLLLAGGLWAARSTGYGAAKPVAASAEQLPPFEDVPMQIGAWRGKPEPIEKNVWAQMGVDAALSRVYKSGDLEVRLLVEARVGGSRDQFHMPMVCMTANGWSTMGSGVEALNPPGMRQPVETTWMLMTQAGQYMLVRYWLWNQEEGYVRAPSALLRQVNAVAAWERLHNANPTGALFLCYTPVPDVRASTEARKAQADFAAEALPYVDDVLRASMQPRG